MSFLDCVDLLWLAMRQRTGKVGSSQKHYLMPGTATIAEAPGLGGRDNRPVSSPEGPSKKSSLTQAALNRANSAAPLAARTLVKWAADDSNAGERLAAAAAVQKRASRESILSADSHSTRSSATGKMCDISCGLVAKADTFSVTNL